MTYQVEIGSKRGDVSVVKEQLRYTRFGGGQADTFLGLRMVSERPSRTKADIVPGAQSADREVQRLESPDILAIKGLGQFQRFEAASALRSLIENWHVSDFHISAARTVQDAGFAEHLSTQGENLPLVARY